MTGQTLSHYQVLDKVGEGGMGTVYRANDLNLRRTVALKFLKENVVGSPNGRARFIHEAQAAAMIEHPNVCPVYGFEDVDGHVFIVMAFVDGQPLAGLLRSTRLPLSDALRIGLGIGEGLTAAHRKRIVHRDIKPANILIAAGGHATITDFGLALLVERTRITQPGTIMGTAAYMSPEQALTRPVDHRSDIWSLGVVLYEMIAGSSPFGGKDMRSRLLSVIRDPVPELHIGTAHHAGFLKSVLTKALQKNPEERYQHMDDFVVDLRALLREFTPISGIDGSSNAQPVPTTVPMPPTQTLIASAAGQIAQQSPLKAAIAFISEKLRGRPDST